jgi:CheY-like chemotaxis protein
MSKTSPQELGSLVVLIVEDEFFLRCNLADCLRDGGWVVMEAATADDAMAMCNAGMAVHVLITDIQLNASASGWDVAEAFRASSSETAVIYTSAHSGDRTRSVPNSLYFAKPYQTTDVLKACRQLVASQGLPQ